MPKVKPENVGVQLDRLTFERVEKQAQRTVGHIQGAVQSYIRMALMKQLTKDEQEFQQQAQQAEQSSV